MGIRGGRWAGLYLSGQRAEVVVEQYDGALDLFSYDASELARAWATFEKTIEGNPGPKDLILQETNGGWSAALWGNSEADVLTGFHSMEELVPAAFRWLEAHGHEVTGDIWMKEGGELFLLELA